MEKEERKQLRAFLKDHIRKSVDFTQTDQSLGYPAPSPAKKIPEESTLIDLPTALDKPDYQIPLSKAISRRQSHRKYLKEPLTLEDVSFLLWASHGVRAKSAGHFLRTVPSAGNRHALETYLAVLNVKGLEPGIYRYHFPTHQLVLAFQNEKLGNKLERAALKQSFAGRGSLTFIWTALPYRMEWRYGEASYKVIAIDAGHVCQNLYLACEAVHAGACAIAAYEQDYADQLLGVDGEDEFVVYMASVGKVKESCPD